MREYFVVKEILIVDCNRDLNFTSAMRVAGIRGALPAT